MSLLLDALNRASKEKQKAAAAAAQAEAPAVVPTPPPAVPPAPEAASLILASAPTEALKWEEIPHPTPDPLPAAPAASQRPEPPVLITPVQPDPEMELTLVDAPPEAATPAPKTRFEPRPSPDLLAPSEIPPLVTVPTELAPPLVNSTPREPTLAAPPPPPAAPAPPAPPPPMSPVPAPAPPPQPPAPAPAPAPVPPASPATASAPALGLDVAPTAKSVPDGQKAQDIRRAYEGPPSDARKGRRRAMALGGLAVGLALAFGSVFLGLWGDPAQWLGGPGVSTVAPPPLVAIQEPAAPAQAALPAEPAASGPVAPVQAPAALAQANAVAPRPAPATAAVSGPSPAVPSAKREDIAKGGPSGKASPAAPRTTPPAPRDTAPKPAVVPAPVMSAQAPAASPTASPAASPASTGNEVVLRANNRANPNFVAKTRGPSALEQGYALLLEGRIDEAASAYSQALRANADERDALLGMAYISQKKGLREDAQTYYRRVLRQEPNNARALAGLQALDSGSDTTLTASRAGDLASRQPDSAAAMAMAGNAFVRDGLLSNAAQAYARAQTLEPANPLHAYNLAVALDRLGRYAAAAAQYERVLSLSSTAPVPERAYQIDDVRLRLAQLRQALAATEPAAP